MSATARRSRATHWLVTTLFALLILVPAGVGFGTKFREFLILYFGDPEGAFTLMPILNYLLAGAGFFCLFLWALWHGMFREIEQPKHRMLAQERELDADDGDDTPPWWRDDCEKEGQPWRP